MLTFLRLSLGGLFVWSASAKLRRWRSFIEILSSYELLPKTSAYVVGGLVVIAELFTGLGLMTAFTARYAATLGILLLLIISVAVFLSIRRGVRNRECGCMLVAGETIGWHILARNTFFGSVLLAELLPQLHGLCVGLASLALCLFVYCVVRQNKMLSPSTQMQATKMPKGCAGCGRNSTIAFGER